METHVQTLCHALAATLDVQVIVAADGPNGAVELDRGVRVRRIGTLASIGAATVNPGMARAIREARADLVHFHHPNPTGVLSYLASGQRGPLVVTYHSDIVRQRVLGLAFAPVLDHFLRRADAILATSPDYLRSSPVLQAHPARSQVLPFGIRWQDFATADPAAVARLQEEHGPRIVLA